MGMRKDYYLKEAALALTMVRTVYLHDLVVVQGLCSYKWVKKATQCTAEELDEAGIRVLKSGDVYDFCPGGGDESTCSEAVEQWRLEALDKVESKSSTVIALADRCGLSRQSLYRIVQNKASGLQHLFTLMEKTPTLLWCGRPLKVCYDKCVADKREVSRLLMERLT